jgi:hypothetical protein
VASSDAWPDLSIVIVGGVVVKVRLLAPVYALKVHRRQDQPDPRDGNARSATRRSYDTCSGLLGRESSSATVDRWPAEATSPSEGESEDPSEPTIGICCSGGGIRSAAFNLGALQTLQDRGILTRAAYLSAVSGGSYIATSMALVRASKATETTTEQPPGRSPANDVPLAFEPASAEEEFLRNHSSYIAPGLTGKARLLGQVIGGLILNLGLIAAPLVIVAAYGGIAYQSAFRGLTQDPAKISLLPWTWRVLVAIGGLFTLLSLSELLINWGEFSRKVVNIARTIALAVLVGLTTILVVIPVALAGIINLLISTHGPDPFRHEAAWIALGATLVGLLAFLFIAPVRYRSFVLALASMAGSWLLLASILLVVLAYFTVSESLTDTADFILGMTFVLATFLLNVLVWVDLVQWSPHPFYVRRLASAFGLQRMGDSIRAYPFNELPPLTSLVTASGPELLICAAAAVSEGGRTPPGRSCMSFVMSPRHVEIPALGVTMETGLLETVFTTVRGREFTAMTAAAVSGAAVSPTMGRMTRRPLTLLFALANVRLGMWMPNPREKDWWLEKLQQFERPWPEGGSYMKIWTRPHALYLLRELLGRARLKNPYLYVTDGGHYENLGLVELLRRQCQIIYCLDATGAATAEAASALDIAIATARSDLGVEITIDPSPILVGSSKELSEQDHVVGQFRYLDGTEGTLVYVRAAVTASTPWDVRQFRKRDRRFPNHSTFNQLFNEEKFEAYRALGAHAAGQAIATMQSKATIATAPGEP